MSLDDVEWADIVFVMEAVHKRRLKERFGAALKDCRVVCLGIPDIYEYMDEELVQLLKQRVPRLVG